MCFVCIVVVVGAVAVAVLTVSSCVHWLDRHYYCCYYYYHRDRLYYMIVVFRLMEFSWWYHRQYSYHCSLVALHSNKCAMILNHRWLSIAMFRRYYRDDDFQRQQLHWHFANVQYDSEHVWLDRMVVAGATIRYAVDIVFANFSLRAAFCLAGNKHRQILTHLGSTNYNQLQL